MDLTLDDPLVQVQLFRFIDALPALKDAGVGPAAPGRVSRRGRRRVPWWLGLALRLAPEGSTAGGMAGRGGADRGRRDGPEVHRRGDARRGARRPSLALRRRKLAFTADLLGEAVISEAEADGYQQTCLDLLRRAGRPAGRRARGPADRPRSARPDPAGQPLAQAVEPDRPVRRRSTPRRSIDRVAGRLRPILRAARERGRLRPRRHGAVRPQGPDLRALRRVLTEPEFRDWPDVGIVVQAYLPETEADLRMLRDWVERRGTPITIRLVKGAYWDYEVVHARQLGWPEPVYLREVADRRVASSAAPGSCCEHHERLRPAFGSHNVRSLAHAIAAAEAMGLPPAAYELQMLYGMGEPIQRALVDRGHRVRVYTPYGALLPGMAYLVRRLLENTSNESFLKASFAARARVDDLLRDPEEIGAMLTRTRRPKAERPAGRRRAAAVPQRAADRLRPRREPRGDARGARRGPRPARPVTTR